MELFNNILSQAIVQRLGWMLVHFVWQAATVALVLAILLKLLGKFSANLRYIVACLALVAVVLLPAVTITLIPVDETYLQSQAAVAPAPEPVAFISTPVEIEHSASMEMPAIEAELPIESIAAAPAIPLKQRITEVLEPNLPYIVMAWLVGVLGLSVWYLGAWTQLQKLRRKMVKPVEESLQRKLKELSVVLGVNRAIEFVESALVQSPTVIGWLKPVILLPASVLTGFSAEQIEAILAHELAHIKRCDYLVNMLQTGVEILGFYHPAVWWISKKIRVERENCCDDIAVKVSGDKIAYAKTLALFEGIKPAQPDLAVAASGGSLFQRICRLIQKDSTNINADWKPSFIAIVLIIALLIPTGFALTVRSEEKVDVQNEEKPIEGFVSRTVSFPMQTYFDLDKDTGYANYSKRVLSDEDLEAIYSDLFVQVSGRVRLMAANMKIATLKNQEFDLSAEEIWSRVKSVTATPQQQLERGGVYAFQTRQKRIGILRVSNFISTEPPSLKFSYKVFSLRFREIPEEKEVKFNSLPNGLMTLAFDDPQVGNAFSFLWGRGMLRKNPPTPEGQKAEPEKAYFHLTYRKGIGDLILDDSEDMMISIPSAKVQPLGEGRLAELLNRPLAAEMQSVGQVPAKLGCRYLVKTMQGNFGLFKVLGIAKRAILIQWICQPDGSTNFSGSGNLLDRKIYYSGQDVDPLYSGSSTPRMWTVVGKLREVGLRVCFEYGKDDYSAKIKRVSGDGTLKSVLDEFVKKTGRHKWELKEGTNIISIYRSKNSLLDWIPNRKKFKTPIKNRSWLSVVKDLDLARHDIQFPHWAGLSVIRMNLAPTPPDKLISIDVGQKDSARDILTKICQEYGDGMYFTLTSGKNGRNGLVFKTNPTLYEQSLLGETKPSDTLKSRSEEKPGKQVEDSKDASSMSMAILPRTPIRSIKEYHHTYWSYASSGEARGKTSYELWVISPDSKKLVRIGGILSSANYGGVQLNGSQQRMAGKLQDGKYLVAVYAKGVRRSNIAQMEIDSDFDASTEPVLTLVPLPLGPGQKLPLLGIRAIGPTPQDPKLMNDTIAFPKLIVDGVERNLTQIIWTGLVGPLESGKVYTRIKNLDGYEPAIEPGRKHTIKAIVGKYESATVVIPADERFSRQWNEAAKKLSQALPPKAAIEGKVTGFDGKAGAGFVVNLFRRNDSFGVTDKYHETTGKDGKYRFENIPSGEYHVVCQYGSRARPDLNIKKVIVDANKTLKLNLSLQTHYKITGRVFYEDGKPAANMDVTVVCKNSEGNLESDNATHTDANGRYEIGGPFANITYIGVNGGRVKGQMPKLKTSETELNYILKKDKNGRYKAFPALSEPKASDTLNLRSDEKTVVRADGEFTGHWPVDASEGSIRRFYEENCKKDLPIARRSGLRVL